MNMKEKQAMAKKFAVEFKDAWKTEAGRLAVAEIIVKYIRLDVEQRDLSELLIDKEYFTLGQKPEYQEFSGLKAYWHEPGSYAPRTTMVKNIFVVPTEMLSCHPEFELGQIKSGRYGTVVDQMVAARKEMLGQTNALVFNTIKNSITGTVSGNSITTTGTVLTKATVDFALKWVNDQTEKAKAIVGRRSKTEDVLDWHTSTNPIYSDRILDEIMRDGVLGIYRGVPIIGLPQYFDGNGQPVIDPEVVLVVGDEVGRYVVEEDIQQMTDIDVDTLMWHMHVWTRVGCAVFHPERAAKITMSGT